MKQSSKRIIISTRFIRCKIPIKVKWMLIDLLHESIDYRLPYGTYLDVLSKHSEKTRNRINMFSKYMKIDDDVVLFNKILLKKLGITLICYKAKQETIDFDRVTKLLQSYNEVRNIYYERMNIKNVIPIPLQPNMTATYNKVLTFLDAHSIDDYTLYFYCLFNHTNWKFVWSLISCRSPRCLDIYSSCKSDCERSLQEVSQVILNKQKEEFEEFSGNKHSKWIHIYPHIERIKRRYVNKGQEDICITNIDQTLGYHPLSDPCCACKIKNVCSKKIFEIFKNLSGLNLDILRIRGKLISTEEVKRQLKQIGSTFDLYD